MNKFQNIAAASLMGIVLACCFNYGQAKPTQAQFERIYSSVANRKLKPDSAGVVTLPTNLASATSDGKIYVTRRGKLLLVLFSIWRGKGSNLKGYLLSNRPLTPADMHKDEYEQKYNAVNLFAPGAWSVPSTPPQFRVPPAQRQTEIILEKKLKGNTYYVSRSFD